MAVLCLSSTALSGRCWKHSTPIAHPVLCSRICCRPTQHLCIPRWFFLSTPHQLRRKTRFSMHWAHTYQSLYCRHHSLIRRTHSPRPTHIPTPHLPTLPPSIPAHPRRTRPPRSHRSGPQLRTPFARASSALPRHSRGCVARRPAASCDGGKSSVP